MRLFFPGGRVCLFSCHGNIYRRDDNFRLWVLYSTHSKVVETKYFPLYSLLAIFVEYFSCFLDNIQYKQLLRKFTSLIN